MSHETTLYRVMDTAEVLVKTNFLRFDTEFLNVVKEISGGNVRYME